MISTCHTCHKVFWFFWDTKWDLPPGSWCSIQCWETRASRNSPGEDIKIPKLPQVILAEMREHRLEAHGCISILGFYDCNQCERLEGEYRESLDWHYRAASAAMITPVLPAKKTRVKQQKGSA